MPIAENLETKEQIFSSERLSMLSDESVSKLERALIVGDNKMAQQVIEEIAVQDKNLAEEMSKMVKNLQIDELLELIEGVAK